VGAAPPAGRTTRCRSSKGWPPGTARGSSLPPVDQMELRNRLVMATQMWKEATAEPLPRMAPGEPAQQLSAFELKLIDMLCAQATAETARDIADKTWDLVHDRGDDDPVKKRVVECHEALARLSARGSGSGF
jgi:hypothetical protein